MLNLSSAVRLEIREAMKSPQKKHLHLTKLNAVSPASELQ